MKKLSLILVLLSTFLTGAIADVFPGGEKACDEFWTKGKIFKYIKNKDNILYTPIERIFGIDIDEDDIKIGVQAIHPRTGLWIREVHTFKAKDYKVYNDAYGNLVIEKR
ncbi:MAG: hypothetical protein IJR50_07505 [Treponema sp.]|nr:hypothetical protein [Treponema sp.]